MLYSIGKDSSVMLHLARKAFYPAPIPFPLLHVDTTWKFREMIAFRDRMARHIGFELVVHTNAEGVAAQISPFDHGSLHYTDVMKTQALKQALDAPLRRGLRRGPTRRSRRGPRSGLPRPAPPLGPQEPAARAVEPLQRPGRPGREHPGVLSNWTELDVWRYIAAEGIEVVPLYLAGPHATA